MGFDSGSLPLSLGAGLFLLGFLELLAWAGWEIYVKISGRPEPFSSKADPLTIRLNTVASRTQVLEEEVIVAQEVVPRLEQLSGRINGLMLALDEARQAVKTAQVQEMRRRQIEHRFEMLVEKAEPLLTAEKLKEYERQQRQIETEMAQLRLAFDKDKALFEQELQARRQAGEQRMALLETELKTREASLEKERAALAMTLAAQAAETGGFTGEHEQALALFNKEAEEAGRRVREAREQAQKQWEALHGANARLLESKQADLDKIGQEKQSLVEKLEKDRVFVRQTFERMENEFEARKAQLQRDRERMESEHNVFAAKSQAETESLARQAKQSQESAESLRKKTEDLRSRHSRHIFQRRERYERLLVRLTQKISREQTAVGARMADEKMAVESARQRVESRRARVRRYQQRRALSLEKLYREAETAHDAVRRGYEQRAREWAEKLVSRRRQLDQWQDLREQFLGAPDRMSEDLQALERQEAQKYEREKFLLIKQAEENLKAFREKSDRNRETLKISLAEIQRMDRKVEDQQASFQEFLEALSRQTVLLQSLRDYFKSPDREDEASQDGVGLRVVRS